MSVTYTTWRLADDPSEYGSDAGKFIVVSGNYHDYEHSGPMGEPDAILLARCLSALSETNDLLDGLLDFLNRMIGDGENGVSELQDRIRAIIQGVTK